MSVYHADNGAALVIMDSRGYDLRLLARDNSVIAEFVLGDCCVARHLDINAVTDMIDWLTEWQRKKTSYAAVTTNTSQPWEAVRRRWQPDSHVWDGLESLPISTIRNEVLDLCDGIDAATKRAEQAETSAKLFRQLAAKMARHAREARRERDTANESVSELVAANNQVAAINAAMTARVADLEARPTVTWIATSDQLPQTELRVLAVHNDGRRIAIIRALHIDPLTVACSDFDQDLEVTIYDPVTERNYYPDGWYEVSDNGDYVRIGPLAGTVTHWAKLPKLPQEA